MLFFPTSQSSQEIQLHSFFFYIFSQLIHCVIHCQSAMKVEKNYVQMGFNFSVQIAPAAHRPPSGRLKNYFIYYNMERYMFKWQLTFIKITKKINPLLVFSAFQSLLSPPATNIQPLPEYKTAAAKKPRWVLSHYGMFKTCWDILVLLATIYVAIVVPYNAAFHDPVRCHTDITSDIHLVGNSILASRYTAETPLMNDTTTSDSSSSRVPRDTTRQRAKLLRALGLDITVTPPSDSDTPPRPKRFTESSVWRHHRVRRKSTSKQQPSPTEKSHSDSASGETAEAPRTLGLSSGSLGNASESVPHLNEVVIEEMDEEQKKASIVIDVIVEAIFIVGKRSSHCVTL